MSDTTEQMRKMSNVDYDKLSDVQKMYIKRFERFNKVRASEHVAGRSLNRVGGGILCLTVLGTYFYTIFAVKQEKLTEEFDQKYEEEKSVQKH